MRLDTLAMLLAVLGTVGCGDTVPRADATAAVDPDPLNGAWLIVERSTEGANPTLNSEPQPGLRLFVDGYFSLARVNGTQPRPNVTVATATADELRAVLGAFTAQSGTYEIRGDTVWATRTVALGPATMAPGNRSVLTYRLAGDTLWLTQVETEAGPFANPETIKYLRVRH